MYGPTRSAIETLENHLRKCAGQPEKVQAAALAQARSKKQKKMQFDAPPSSEYSGPDYSAPGRSNSAPQFYENPYASSSFYEFGDRSASPSIAPSDSLSNIGPGLSRSLSSGHIGQGRRPSSSHGVPSDSAVWMPAKQINLERRLTRLTASAGLPLSWIDNIEWIYFMNEFLPGGRSPSRKVLSRRLIPAMAAELRAEAKVFVKGQNATVQADGWTGENHHHLIAFMITANQKVRKCITMLYIPI